jgi:hypothetical protein
MYVRDVRFSTSVHNATLFLYHAPLPTCLFHPPSRSRTFQHPTHPPTHHSPPAPLSPSLCDIQIFQFHSPLPTYVHDAPIMLLRVFFQSHCSLPMYVHDVSFSQTHSNPNLSTYVRDTHSLSLSCSPSFFKSHLSLPMVVHDAHLSHSRHSPIHPSLFFKFTRLSQCPSTTPYFFSTHQPPHSHLSMSTEFLHISNDVRESHFSPTHTHFISNRFFSLHVRPRRPIFSHSPSSFHPSNHPPTLHPIPHPLTQPPMHVFRDSHFKITLCNSQVSVIRAS